MPRSSLRSRRKDKIIFRSVLINTPWLIVLPLAWMVLGFIEVFSASRFRAMQLRGFPTYFMQLDFLWRLIGLIVFTTVIMIRSDVMLRLLRASYILWMSLLVVLLFSTPINGARRWFGLGPVNLHPAEFMKLALVPLIAQQLVRAKNYSCNSYKEHIHRHIKGFIQYVLLVVVLIVLQPDLSTAMLVTIVALFMYLYKFASDRFIWRDIGYGGIALILGLILGIILEPYRLQRFKVYWVLLTQGKVTDIFGSGNQIYHILIGISRGGLWGVGITQSRQQAGYLVETTAFTDSIAAVIFEELGLVIGSLLIFSYWWWFKQVWRFTQGVSDPVRELVLVGLGFLIFSQAFIHFAVNLALIPITGMTLPFISYGGSALLSNMIALGVMARIIGENIH